MFAFLYITWYDVGCSRVCQRNVAPLQKYNVINRRALTCFCIVNQVDFHRSCFTNNKGCCVNAAISLWPVLSLHIPPSFPHAGLTLCHWETEGIHRAGGQDSASGAGQRWQDHPAEEPRLWRCEHHHTDAGERKLDVKTHTNTLWPEGTSLTVQHNKARSVACIVYDMMWTAESLYTVTTWCSLWGVF